ncbi:MAG: histidinol dehydrogenase [Bacteroidetes bacterium]|nr:histidinol dehydrogenase [Bacteroidota bacterium]
MNIVTEPQPKDWPQLLQRPVLDTASLDDKVQLILKDVQQNGDAAIKKYAQQFDGVALHDFLVTAEEIQYAVASVDEGLKAAIETAKNNITLFHTQQKEKRVVVETTNGVHCWRKSVAIENVGLYIPGGTAPLFSTLLMLGIPATIAGCSNIVVCTPCDKNGNVNPVVLYVAQTIGIKKIYKIGGVQAIAAMAYGTATVPKVNKIFGPGNQYVTCAKQLISKEGVAIDMPAGPSEVAVYADASGNAAFIAADLLSQAEHGTDSQVILVASSSVIVDTVQKELELQVNVLPRKDIAIKALQNSTAIVMNDVNAAFALLNTYAPEHLIIASDDAEALAEKVVNAGSVFLGHYSPESAGDYASGTNHTLPTNGYAKAYSGVSLDSFVKKITFQQLSTTGLQNIGPAIEQMAAAEGLQAHKNAVSIRLKAINTKL